MYVLQKLKQEGYMQAIFVHAHVYVASMCVVHGDRNINLSLFPPPSFRVFSSLTDQELIYTSLCAQSQSGVAAAY